MFVMWYVCVFHIEPLYSTRRHPAQPVSVPSLQSFRDKSPVVTKLRHRDTKCHVVIPTGIVLYLVLFRVIWYAIHSLCGPRSKSSEKLSCRTKDWTHVLRPNLIFLVDG